jgi:K+ transporter
VRAFCVDLWSLIWVVSIKYMMFVLRADNQGEGGIMALTALARRAAGKQALPVAVGLIGGAVLRRQHDHPGDFRVVGDRRPGPRVRRH